MKKLLLCILCLFLYACTHISEQVIGYNEEGKTLVRVCKSTGTPAYPNAYGSECLVELRDYGRITTKAETVNIVSTEKK